MENKHLFPDALRQESLTQASWSRHMHSIKIAEKSYISVCVILFFFSLLNTNLSHSFAEKQVQNTAFRTRVLIPGELHQRQLQPKVCCHNIQPQER